MAGARETKPLARYAAARQAWASLVVRMRFPHRLPPGVEASRHRSFSHCEPTKKDDPVIRSNDVTRLPPWQSDRDRAGLGQYNCSNQGGFGWMVDVYTSSLPCQFIIIDGVRTATIAIGHHNLSNTFKKTDILIIRRMRRPTARHWWCVSRVGFEVDKQATTRQRSCDRLWPRGWGSKPASPARRACPGPCRRSAATTPRWRR